MLLPFIDRSGQAEKGTFHFSMYAWLGHDFQAAQELYHPSWFERGPAFWAMSAAK